MMPVVLALTLSAPLTLDEVRAASRENLDAVRSEIALGRAEENTRTARAAVLPQVALTSQIGMTASGPQRFFTTVPNGAGGFDQAAVDVPGNTRANFIFGLQLTQLLFDGGRWWNELARTGAARDAAQGQLAEQRLASELEAQRRFFELLRAQAVQQVLQSSVERSQAQLERTQGFYEAGRVQKRDAIDAEVNLDADRIGLLRQGPQIAQARAALLGWLARRPTDAVEAVDPGVLTLPLAAGPRADEAQALAERQRPLWKALDDQERAFSLAVATSRAAYLPRISAQAGYLRQAATADPFFTDPTKQNTLTLGLALQWDLFSGFATDAQVARARLDLDENHRQREQALRDLSGDLQTAVTTLDAQLEIAKLADSSCTLAESALNLAVERFKAGAGSTLEVRDSQLKLTQAQLQRLQSRIDLAIARAVVDRLTGVTSAPGAAR